MGDGLPDVSSSPLVVYAAMAVVVTLAVATISERGLGPISRAYYRWARERREAAADRRATDYAQLEAQIRHLGVQLAKQRLENANIVAGQDQQIDELRREIRARDTCAVAHQRWDRQVLSELSRLGGHVDEPPPLWPADES